MKHTKTLFGAMVLLASAVSAATNGIAHVTEQQTTRAKAATNSTFIINEIMVDNTDMFLDPSLNYGAWIEIYNPTDATINLKNYYVSNDPSNPKKFHLQSGTVKPHGFANIWFDHYEANLETQVNFKLSTEGGTVLIADASGNIVAQADFPAAISRASYARTTDGGDTWKWTAEPTPEATNATSTFADSQLAAPEIEADEWLFDASAAVRVHAPEAGATLVYTTDGSTPTRTNGNEVQTGKTLYLYETTPLRVRAFKDGYLPSTVVTQTFIENDKDFTLPILSIATDNANLYDDYMGCYVRGTNGIAGRGQTSPCNWNRDWDRPVNFEYFTADGTLRLSQEADFAVAGGWSRAYEPRSFKIKAGKRYEGKNTLDYPFFERKPFLKYKTLQMRGGGNDNGCRLKDAALQSIILTSGLDVEGQEYQPVVFYINGQYKGLINMREPNNKDYAYANYGLGSDEIDQFEIGPDSCYSQMCGTKDIFDYWVMLSDNADDDAYYQEICDIVDIDEYINYMASEMFMGAVDWPRNNVKGFRKIDGGRFRFVLFDLDGTLSTTSPFKTLEGQEYAYGDADWNNGGNRLYLHNEFVTIFLNMLKNADFRKKYVDTFCLIGGSVFTPERVTAIVDSLAARTAGMMAYEGASPYGTANSIKSTFNNTGRYDQLLSSLKSYTAFNMKKSSEQSVKLSSNTGKGRLFVNDIPVPTGKFDGKLFAPVVFRAEAPGGYRFAGWVGAGATLTNIVDFGENWKYYDQGSLDGRQWYSTTYSDYSWSEGQAPLGFANVDAMKSLINTTLDYGTDTQGKRPTYYFRKKFNLSKVPSGENSLQLKYKVDDGMIVYVNGIKAAQYNMPDGNVTYDTYATTYAGNLPDEGTLTVSPSLLNPGENVIAIEVHNSSAGSSDIFFDLQIAAAEIGEADFLSTEAEYTMPTTGNVELTAIFEPIEDEEREEEKICPVRINEVSAANTIYCCEYYKRNDWVELYNTTPEPIDIAGMYLSDNRDKLQKFQIPAAQEGDGFTTVIPPYGHYVIWCDKLETQTQMHASFKLAAEGDTLYLSDAEGKWIDIFPYPAHGGEETAGRFPDGSDNFYVMTKPTMALPNQINSYCTTFVPEIIDVPVGIETTTTEASNMKVFYVDGRLCVLTAPGTRSATFTVCNTLGQQLLRDEQTLDYDGSGRVYLNLQEGCYVARVTDSNGNHKQLKFIVR